MKPLVTAHVNLRDFRFMPLDVGRLWDSDLAAQATADEFRAAVLLWCKAWHQVPAGSMPNDDAILAQASGCGRGPHALKQWRRLRDGALRGWVLCDDGRLYHSVVAEKAEEAWVAKLKDRFRRECERIKKAAQRADEKPVYPTFEEWRVANDVPDVSRGTDSTCPKGQTGDVPGDVPAISAPKGQRQGQGEGQGKDSLSVGGSEALGSHARTNGAGNGQSTQGEGQGTKALTPAEIQEASTKAWDALFAQIKSVGTYGKPQYADPVAEKIIRTDMGGWSKLCKTSEREIVFARVEFKRRYAELVAGGART